MKTPLQGCYSGSLRISPKNYRLYAWIGDYSEEFIATDWLLREIDNAFGREGISIPYPVNVELQNKPSPFPEGETGGKDAENEVNTPACFQNQDASR